MFWTFYFKFILHIFTLGKWSKVRYTMTHADEYSIIHSFVLSCSIRISANFLKWRIKAHRNACDWLNNADKLENERSDKLNDLINWNIIGCDGFWMCHCKRQTSIWEFKIATVIKIIFLCVSTKKVRKLCTLAWPSQMLIRPLNLELTT